MKTLLQLAALVAIGYGLWAYGVPWIQQQVGRSAPPVTRPAPGAGGTCVQVAARAAEELHTRMLDSGRPLIEDRSWVDVTNEVGSALHQARVSCDCKLDSCAQARRALSTLGGVFASARGQFRSSQSVPLELGRQYEQANQELWDAYDLARDGK
ncbi:MAG TPA: hypothetical protein VMS86_07435 [Thermoanaerobaculia bacterium]|nr:hypothetical protein [Thermoanaerobaculia bacterium]